MRDLRTWQREALDAWRTKRRGVASVVTGAGKTTFAIACIDLLRRELPLARTLIVVPSVALLDQWLVELQVTLSIPRSDIALHGGGTRDTDAAPIHIAVVNTARSLTSQLTERGDWMLVADECHRYGAPTNRAAIRGDWVAAIGLSATPTREYDDWFERFVTPQIGNVFYEYGYERALRDGVLTPFTLANYRIPLTTGEKADLANINRQIALLITKGTDESDAALRRATFRRARLVQGAHARLPAARQIMRGRKGVRSLVFHEQISAANKIVQMLNQDGHRVAGYHSGLAAPTRQKNLLMFRTGQIDALVACRALDEGLDVPDAEFGLICASTSSTRQRIQRMGRLIRRSPMKDTAEVATIFAGEAEADRLADEAATMVGLAETRWYSVAFS